MAGLAHAIKNVSSGLRGGAFVLEKGIELNNRKYLGQGWDMIKGNVDKVKNMALDLLSYSKERAPDYELTDPNGPAQQVADLMGLRAAKYGVKFVVDLEGSLGPVWLDPSGIHRCLMNLVINAIDACTDVSCSHKQGKVVVQSLKTEGWAVEYQVTDNGCGMDDETGARVFQSFFSTKGSKGTGLGLMITKKIIDEHGGVIELESEKGTGSKFVIRLPERDGPPESRIYQEAVRE